jgi:Domain of unknown function (DUF4397)
MKNNISKIVGVFVTSLLLGACGGETANPYKDIAPAQGAHVKFYHAAPDAPAVDIFVNDQRLSGIYTVPPAVAGSLAYFNSFPLQDYAAIAPGTAKTKVVVPVSATTPTETTALAADVAVEDGKYYSVFAYGAGAKPEALLWADNLTAADKSKAYIRFVNLVTGTPVGGYDLAVNGVVLYKNVDYKAGSPSFLAIDPITFGATAIPIQLRAAGTATVVSSTTLQPYSNRFYTFIGRGLATEKTGAKVPTLSVSVNL